MYMQEQSEFHLPRVLIIRSRMCVSAAAVAAPIRNECPLYNAGS